MYTFENVCTASIEHTPASALGAAWTVTCSAVYATALGGWVSLCRRLYNIHVVCLIPQGTHVPLT